MESNDSPDIPDRGETSDIPGLPSELKKRTSWKIFTFCPVLLISCVFWIFFQNAGYLKIVEMLIRLIMSISRPLKLIRQALPLSTLLASRRSSFVPADSVSSSSTFQIFRDASSCDRCFAMPAVYRLGHPLCEEIF